MTPDFGIIGTGPEIAHAGGGGGGVGPAGPAGLLLSSGPLSLFGMQEAAGAANVSDGTNTLALTNCVAGSSGPPTAVASTSILANAGTSGISGNLPSFINGQWPLQAAQSPGIFMAAWLFIPAGCTNATFFTFGTGASRGFNLAFPSNLWTVTVFNAAASSFGAGGPARDAWHRVGFAIAAGGPGSQALYVDGVCIGWLSINVFNAPTNNAGGGACAPLTNPVGAGVKMSGLKMYTGNMNSFDVVATLDFLTSK